MSVSLSVSSVVLVEALMQGRAGAAAVTSSPAGWLARASALRAG
ncbi:hypothetical protein ACIBEA_16105 [Streptomyces sp. NPDC051555]